MVIVCWLPAPPFVILPTRVLKRAMPPTAKVRAPTNRERVQTANFLIGEVGCCCRSCIELYLLDHGSIIVFLIFICLSLFCLLFYVNNKLTITKK